MSTTTTRTTEQALEGLKTILADRLVTSQSVREHHSRDLSRFPAVLPDAVAFPQNEEEVASIVRVCAENLVPIIPVGAVSSLDGHIIPVKGGVTVSTRDMNRIIEIRPEDMLAVVEPGVTRKQLNTALRATGLMFPIDPGADATIGGMASTRGSGTTAVRYGTMRENILALRVVTPDGTVIHTGSRAKKSATGYDLTHLYVGSEGTLGFITELTVRLHPIPEMVSSAICAFPDVQSAVETVIECVQYGIPVARVEFLDKVAIGGVNAYSKLDLQVAPTLFFEFHGTPAWVAEQSQIAEEISANHNGTGFKWSTDADERTKLWQARHDALWAARALKPGCEVYGGDICVPISRLAESIVAASEDIAASFLTGQVIGHVGDGNFHTAYLIDPEKPEDYAEAERLADRMLERALAVGGTASGEHGIGIGKLKFMRKEHGDAVDVMKRIKQALDPLGIMNPGKMGQEG
ncbi:lactate dehydrogenase [Nitratireductor aestuarii]|uniref:D-lactate dehydrogenase (cytochrome) n=1 Tax=Nitratireductor aestuarii TaxID=1735103 RepID=A0A916W3H5_9HYPH|nr:FAD-linked oxidase C-terminal domain-containing protein [Nitratireductor aestuarii]GGA63099.1 lactate dehydrogenase [Nitratireductor aestuarii]